MIGLRGDGKHGCTKLTFSVAGGGGEYGEIIQALLPNLSLFVPFFACF